MEKIKRIYRKKEENLKKIEEQSKKDNKGCLKKIKRYSLNNLIYNLSFRFVLYKTYKLHEFCYLRNDFNSYR